MKTWSRPAISLLFVLCVSLIFLSTSLALAVEAIVTFTKIADSSTLIPDGSGNTFSGLFTSPSISNGNVAFGQRTGSGRVNGLYAKIGGSLRVIVDTTTLVPGGPIDATFSEAFSDPDISGENVGFTGGGRRLRKSYGRLYEYWWLATHGG